MSAPVPLRLRPLEIGDLLDETIRMYRRHFFLFAGVSVIVSIPAAALWAYVSYTVFNPILEQAGNGQTANLSSSGLDLSVVAAVALVYLLLLPFVQGAVTYAVCESALGHDVTAWGVVRGVLRRYFQLLVYVILPLLMALLFCVFPLWIWIWIGWVGVMPAMFVENKGLFAAMGRSWRLVEGRWWRTFLIIVLIYVLIYVVGTALGGFLLGAQLAVQIILSSVTSSWIFQAASIVLGSLVNPILQIALVLVYFDLRVRREGMDLFQLAQHLAAPQPAS